MVKITAALVAALASTAAASAHRNVGRRHIHPRNYPVAPAPSYEQSPPAETTPVASTSVQAGYPVAPPPSSVETTTPIFTPSTTPVASSSVVEGYPVETPPTSVETTPVASESSVEGYPVETPSSIETTPVASSSSEGGYPVSSVETTPVASSSTEAGYPVHPPETTPVASSSEAGYPVHPVPSAETTPVVSVSTATVVPIPETTPVASESVNVPEYPTHPAPAPSHPAPAPSHPAPAPSHPAEEQPSYPAEQPSTVPVASSSEEQDFCAPVTVYVTATAPVESVSTTEIPSTYEQTTPVASESSIIVSSSSAPVETYPVVTPDVPSSSAEATYPASSSPAAPSQPASHPPPAGSKRGLIYTEGSNLEAFHNVPSIGWTWNWNNNDFGKSSAWNYVPIINNEAQSEAFPEAARNAINTATEGERYVMGLNEPDQIGGGGAGVSVSQAVQNYITYVNPLADSARLGSISITSDQSVGSGKGLEYLAAWKEECDRQSTPCQVDFVCLHWYGPDAGQGVSGADQAQLFIDYVDTAVAKVHELYGPDMKVWVTEFGAQPSLDQDREAVFHAPFMAAALPYLDNNADVERYSYFMASPDYLINADGSLTAGGQAYCDA